MFARKAVRISDICLEEREPFSCRLFQDSTHNCSLFNKLGGEFQDARSQNLLKADIKICFLLLRPRMETRLSFLSRQHARQSSTRQGSPFCFSFSCFFQRQVQPGQTRSFNLPVIWNTSVQSSSSYRNPIGLELRVIWRLRWAPVPSLLGRLRCCSHRMRQHLGLWVSLRTILKTHFDEIERSKSADDCRLWLRAASQIGEPFALDQAHPVYDRLCQQQVATVSIKLIIHNVICQTTPCEQLILV